MEEIFDRWINSGSVRGEDIIIIMLEYDSTFNEGKLTAEKCLLFMNNVPIPLGEFVNNCLRKLSVAKNLDIIEVYDKNGFFLRRFWNKPNNDGLLKEN